MNFSRLLPFLPVAALTLPDFIAWYGAGYLATFILGLMFLVLAVMGVGEHDAAAEHDLDHDIDHDIDVEHDVETDHDVGHESEHDHEVEQAHGLMHSILNLLGIGRCPLSIIMMTFLFLFTGIGIGSLLILKPITFTSVIFGTVSYSVAFLGALFLTGSIARLIGRYLPTKETYVKGTASLHGKIGKANYDFSDNTGFFQVVDDNHTMLEKKGINIDPDNPIKARDSVLIVTYNKEKGCFLVKKAPPELVKS
ncbi:DUF1449 family protein [Candidatus Falkowbacteria bacterium]|jgi:hypothetical protein|nr:DUF1449 family protein [Candidatus Falkowbacteria bacterium]MBT6574034.1 DUF1449 family protein [Candidatus Falkowbacteria bacterium]MBT7348604.1 DUF1449 family protein [Candidatus Falkowbacteria bacterium]MBT7500394.1 DUF1449 family protein [Candidatus Falkowbacteria bacterium]